jgi:hypothetical protein
VQYSRGCLETLVEGKSTWASNTCSIFRPVPPTGIDSESCSLSGYQLAVYLADEALLRMGGAWPPCSLRSWADLFPHCARRTSTLLFLFPPSQWGSGLPALNVRTSIEALPRARDLEYVLSPPLHYIQWRRDLVGLRLRASNEGLLRPRVARSFPPAPSGHGLIGSPTASVERSFFFSPTPNTMGWDGSSLHCARRSRPFLGRAIREHRERTVSSHNSRPMMMYQQPLIPDPLEQIRG